MGQRIDKVAGLNVGILVYMLLIAPLSSNIMELLLRLFFSKYLYGLGKSKVMAQITKDFNVLHRLKKAIAFVLLLSGMLVTSGCTSQAEMNIVVSRPENSTDVTGHSIWAYFNPDNHIELKEPGKQTYSLQLDASQPYFISERWCAWNPELLESNLQSVKFELIIDGILVPQEKIHQAVVHIYSGDECKLWMTNISGWDENTVTIVEYRFILSDWVDTGHNVYPPGKYREIFRVSFDR